MRGHDDTPIDRHVADLARRQHGVVEHGQLRRLGLSEAAIEWRLKVGRLHAVHRGVYAVGHVRLSATGRRIAALLACGPRAVLSHQTAGDHLNIRPSASPAIHVTVPTTAGVRRPEIRLHRTRRLREQDVIVHEELPVTSVARTLLDLAPTLDVPQLRRAIERAMRHGLYDDRAMRDLIPGRATRKLRAALEEADPAPFRSNLESDFLALCRSSGLPRPAVNVPLAGYEVDFVWLDRRVVVEIDSWWHHSGRRSFGDDRRRDVDLALAGFTVLRFTDEELLDTPRGIVTKVARLVA
jgi:hypothetical protein